MAKLVPRLDKLPVELLEKIILDAELSRKEKIEYRLVCRAFHYILTPLVFHTVYTHHFSRTSFDKLYSIARSPHLAEFVAEYVYVLEEFRQLRMYSKMLLYPRQGMFKMSITDYSMRR